MVPRGQMSGRMDGRTGQDRKKLIAAFRNFENAPKKIGLDYKILYSCQHNTGPSVIEFRRVRKKLKKNGHTSLVIYVYPAILM